MNNKKKKKFYKVILHLASVLAVYVHSVFLELYQYTHRSDMIASCMSYLPWMNFKALVKMVCRLQT